MKKTIIFTMGTRGDVQPYIYLAKALQKRGYDITIGSHPCWQSLVEEAGVSFVPVGPDIDIEYEAAVIRGKASNPMVSMLRTMNFIFKIVINSTEDVMEYCKTVDFVISSHSMMGEMEAEALGLPVINVVLQKEMIPEAKKIPTWKEKLFSKVVGAQMVKPYNKIRKKLGLAKLTSEDPILRGMVTIIPISSHVVPYNPYWEDKNKLVGYWYDEEEAYTPTGEISAFLEKGEKPLLLCLGAMSFESQAETEKLSMFIEAFQETGHRAMIQGFHKSMEQLTLPDTMLAVGSVPHSYLFRQGYAVLHHCGFGTANASMIYGIPSIPIPHVLDQMGFAQGLYDAGVATSPLQAGKLTKDKIVAAIQELDQHYDTLSARAAELSKLLKEEDGLKNAVDIIEQVVGYDADTHDRMLF